MEGSNTTTASSDGNSELVRILEATLSPNTQMVAEAQKVLETAAKENLVSRWNSF